MLVFNLKAGTGTCTSTFILEYLEYGTLSNMRNIFQHYNQQEKGGFVGRHCCKVEKNYKG